MDFREIEDIKYKQRSSNHLSYNIQISLKDAEKSELGAVGPQPLQKAFELLRQACGSILLGHQFA